MLPIASTPGWYFLWHVAVVIAAAHPCAGGQSRSMFAGALQGEIYGEGEQYGHKGDIGAPLLYDGNIHTYFDCLGPSRAKPASRSLLRALLTPWVNTGSLYRCSRST